MNIVLNEIVIRNIQRKDAEPLYCIVHKTKNLQL